jgi:S-DNA-T family DNA segregation ATPase FtsK/SpoIIIE
MTDDLRALLRALPVARNLDGRTWRMPIEGQHIFVAAATGGGKGSWIWAVVLGLAPAWHAGLVKYWGIDPKMIELAMGRGFWNYYADNDADSVALLEKAVDAMHERSKRMQGISRKFVPSRETPLHLLVVDEMGYLSAYMSDDKLRKQADKALRALLAKGRAPGFVCLGLLQDPRKEVCGYRDQFSIRIAGCMPAPMVDLVLGEGMYEAGAWCDQIPMPRPDGPGGSGVAYVIDETTRKPRLVRAPWSSDQTIRAVLARYSPAVPKDEPPE